MTEKNPGKISESRRRFVKNAGKLAVYTPPAMVALMQPSKVAFARSGGGGLSFSINGLSRSIKGLSVSIKGLSQSFD